VQITAKYVVGDDIAADALLKAFEKFLRMLEVLRSNIELNWFTGSHDVKKFPEMLAGGDSLKKS